MIVRVGAGQTQRAFLSSQRDPGFGDEIFVAFAAGGVAGRDEDFEIIDMVMHLFASDTTDGVPLDTQAPSVFQDPSLTGVA